VATHNAIIVALLNGEFTVKRLYHKGQTIYLLPANRRYKPLRITEHMDFQVWGVVTYCIRKVR
jgi:DNA polymerase V